MPHANRVTGINGLARNLGQRGQQNSRADRRTTPLRWPLSVL